MLRQLLINLNLNIYLFNDFFFVVKLLCNSKYKLFASAFDKFGFLFESHYELIGYINLATFKDDLTTVNVSLED